MKLKTFLPSYLLLLLLGLWVTKIHAQPSVWDVLRKQFAINHQISQPEVQNQLRWLVSHPGYLEKLAQAEPYMYHIISELKKRRLPGEIALIPMIESSYDPFAYSGAGAAGLWQLMPNTGKELGLKRDWWLDGRRSIRPSTNAALNYLTYLHRFFNGDWVLAFAAYDSGEGALARAIRRSPQNSRRKIYFWSLPVPNETKAYIPRLLALAEVIQNPQRYRIQLPNIPHVPYFKEVNVGGQIDLNHAAKLAGISYKELIKLNPGFNRWATAPYSPYKLLIPANKVERFHQNLAKTPEEKRVNWKQHKIMAGDTLALVAQRYHTTVRLIKDLNRLKTNTVKPGQLILIPNINPTPLMARNTNTDTTKPFSNQIKYKLVHIVQKNDNYQIIERKYHVSKQDIEAWNQISAQTPLHTGQELIIWKQPQIPHTYTVKAGDNLSTIAKLNHTTVRAILAKNPELRANFLRPRQKIQLG